MAKQENIEIDREAFPRNESFIFHKTQDIFEKKKYLTEVKSEILDAEKYRDMLKEYLKLSETVTCNSSKIGQITTNITMTNMKKVLFEFYESNFDSFLQKEKKLIELKKLIEDDNDSTMLKDQNMELIELIKEFESLKAKNIRLNEIMSMNIKQKCK
ncbi:uncharacterized protein LOC112693139 [Sipha flava]|uniref:Uncharacterized protein LOC112693139 n=1 Tax=Sipha flava TaxID=143950 RepID=A0A8B8GLB6_9HEMI|nr:uncharacterized protein LOC112693139 [Sipha flava]XP_025423847.1 uncharacterized protein LOC112693139 [Sipha flava]XP_025423848.1 uncharacterized protein LOC112693139 [Sipha flava]